MAEDGFGRVIKRCQMIKLPTDTILCRQDDLVDSLFIVIAGNLRLLRRLKVGDPPISQHVQLNM